MSTRHAPHTRRIGARRRRERRRGSALILLLLALALPPPQVLLLVVMLFHRDPLDREISLVCPSTALLVLQAAGVLNNDWFHRPSPSIGLFSMIDSEFRAIKVPVVVIPLPIYTYHIKSKFLS
jgi:hypothetical protein